MNRSIRMTHLVFLFFFWGLPHDLTAAPPEVSNLMVTDVATRSFSVIWAADEPSVSDLKVFDDEDGQVMTAGVTTIVQPVESGDETIRQASEDRGVMKVTVTGLAPSTTYYFQTITTSKSAGEARYFPDAPPFLPVTTETRVVKTEMGGETKMRFSNDLIQYDSLLPGGTDPAAGTLLVVTAGEGSHPVSAFVGDGVALPAALVDLNNLFDAATHENLKLIGGETLSIIQFMGMDGVSTASYYVPQNRQLAEVKRPADSYPCNWDLDGDGDVDGRDLALVVADLPSYTAEDYIAFAGEFGANGCTISLP